MSGIAGICYLDGRPVQGAELEAVSGRLAHRGPDGSGAWHSGPAGLVHRLFWATPESLHERQPIIKRRPDGMLAITADARIDNRDELSALLRLDASDSPDCAFILAAYEKWGDACVERLVGDFAFAIWDGGRQQFLCARDPMGIKPFFFYQSPRLFVFASEIKSLFGVPDVPREPNELQIANYLDASLSDPSLTFYQDILRLPAGHCLTVSPASTRLRRYWSVDLGRELRLPSDEAYAESFREIFAEAVRCRLRSTFPVASMLSGGLDSSSITCTARQLLAGASQKLHTFSVIFDETPSADERQYMDAVIAQGDLNHHQVLGDRLSPLTDIEHVLWHTDEPFHGPGFCYQWRTFQAAHEQGLRLLLTGDGGDAVVSYGLFRLADLTRSGHWITLLHELQAFASAKGQGWRWAAEVWRDCAGRPLLPGWARRARRAALGLRPSGSPGSFIHRDFARDIDRSPARRANRARQLAQPRTQREEYWRGVQQVLLVADLYDRTAPAWGVELRHPLMDQRLAEYCMAVPSEQKFQQGETRSIFRRAMRGVLPESIRKRGSKTTPVVSLAHAMMRDDRSRLDEIILADAGPWQSFVDVGALRRAYRALGSDDHVALDDWPALVRIVEVATLALWMRQTSATRELIPAIVG